MNALKGKKGGLSSNKPGKQADNKLPDDLVYL